MFVKLAATQFEVAHLLLTKTIHTWKLSFDSIQPQISTNIFYLTHSLAATPTNEFTIFEPKFVMSSSVSTTEIKKIIIQPLLLIRDTVVHLAHCPFTEKISFSSKFEEIEWIRACMNAYSQLQVDGLSAIEITR